MLILLGVRPCNNGPRLKLGYTSSTDTVASHTWSVVTGLLRQDPVMIHSYTCPFPYDRCTIEVVALRVVTKIALLASAIQLVSGIIQSNTRCPNIVGCKTYMR